MTLPTGWVGVGLGALLGMAVVTAPTLAVIVILSLLVLGLLVALARALRPAGEAELGSRIFAWTLAAFILHLAAGLVIWHSASLVSYLGPDALFYHGSALALLAHWTTNTPPPPLPYGKTGFIYMLTGLYWVFGSHGEAGLVVNAGFGAAIIPVMADATMRRYGPAAARYVPPLLLLLPGFALWPSQLLREAGVYFFMATAINCTVRLLNRTTIPSLGMLAMSLALIVSFRADVGLVLAAGLVISMALGREKGGGMMTALGATALLLALVVGVGLGYSGYHLITQANLQQVSAVRQGSTASASGFQPGVSISSPGRAAAYLPLGFTDFMLGPFPWQVHTVRELPAVPDALAWWFLLPSLWRGIRTGRRRLGRGLVLEVLPAVLLALLLSLLFANFGTVVRERMQVILPLVPLIAVGWAARHGPRPDVQGQSAPLLAVAPVVAR